MQVSNRSQNFKFITHDIGIVMPALDLELQRTPNGDTPERIVLLVQLARAEGEAAPRHLELGVHGGADALDQLAQRFLEASHRGHAAAYRCRAHVLYL